MTKPDAKKSMLQGSILIKVQERPAHGPQKAGCLLGLPEPGGEGGEAHGLTGMLVAGVTGWYLICQNSSYVFEMDGFYCP